MARTVAERQAAYRARQSEASDQRRISTWINSEAALALEALADRYGVTMREVIEMLLLREREVIDNSMINKDSRPRRAPRKRGVLPSNGLLEVPFPVESFAADALPRNAGLGKAAVPQPPPESVPIREPARGEQYSMEL